MTGLDSLDPAELLELAALGAKFREQHRGRRPGALHREIERIARGRRLSFAELLERLETQAARRELYGADASCVEGVDRIWSEVIYHDGRRRQVTFARVRNCLSKINRATVIPASR